MVIQLFHSSGGGLVLIQQVAAPPGSATSAWRGFLGGKGAGMCRELKRTVTQD